MKGADGIMYVYDITEKGSFDNLKNWIRQSEDSTEGFKKIIVGNKSDLELDRNVPKESLQKFCDDRKLKGVEVSAKLGTNVSETFECLAKMILADKSKEEIIKVLVTIIFLNINECLFILEDKYLGINYMIIYIFL